MSVETPELNSTFEIKEDKIERKSILVKTSKSGTNQHRVTFGETSIIMDHMDSCSTPIQSTSQNENIGRLSNTLPHNTSGKSLNMSGNKVHHIITTSPFYNKHNAGNTPAKSILKEVISSKKKLKNGMPDYARIHQRMFDKMLDIQEYKEHKIQRAKLLLSGRKPDSASKKNNIEAKSTSVEIARRLNFSNNKSKPLLKNTVNLTNSKQITKISKSPTKRKEQELDVANKTHTIKHNKERVKQELKGIRTNRRFELLMNYRKTQAKK